MTLYRIHAAWRITLVLLLAALIVLFPHPALSAPASPPAQPKPAAPALWRIKDADSTIYLFGTFHMLPKNTVWRTPTFDRAMVETQKTVTEADVESSYARRTMAQLAMQYGLNPEWQTLRGALGAERYAKFAALAKRHGLSTRQMEPMRPWLATLQLTVAVVTASGFDREHGVEQTVLALAKDQHDSVGALETVETEIKALASLDGAETLADFDHTIDELADAEHKLAPAVEAWRTGDVATIDRLMVADMRTRTPAAYRALLVERNRTWVDEIARWHAGNGTYFIAVGAAHLTGTDSVIAMLQKKGIKAERVQ